MRSYQKRARAPKGSNAHGKLVADLDPLFPEFRKDPKAKENAINDTIKAFADKDIKNANLRYVLASRIAQVQPVFRTEMPEFYLAHPNFKIFYVLKTFTIRQFDYARSKAYDEIKKGNYKKGFGALFKLVGFWTVMGGGVDKAIDWLLKRASNFDDRTFENILQAAGVTRWTVWKAYEEGPIAALRDTATPPYKFFDDFYRDAKLLTQGEFELKHSEAIKHMPWIGKVYYWRYGKGREKEKKRQAANN